MRPQIAYLGGCKVKLVAFVWFFFTVCFQIIEQMQSYIGYICLTFLQCVFSNVFVNCIAKSMYTDTGYICLTCLYYGFSNVSSNRLPDRMHIHTGYICWICLPSAFSNVFLNSFSKGMQNQVGQICICLICHLLPPPSNGSLKLKKKNVPKDRLQPSDTIILEIGTSWT